MSDKYCLYSAANSFLKEKEKYTVDNLLSSNILFDDFIHQLCGLDLDNATGSAYRSVFLGYYEDGILLGSNHHSNNICDIKIASNPKNKWFLGDQNSRYDGNSHPKLEDGKWVTVWDYSTKKLKDGPWVNKVKEVIQDIINKATEKSIRLVEEEKQELEQKRLEKEKFESELVNNWS